ncbi:FecCD family ABC transporter permease [Actinoplanes regularis]|uniref:Iron complex transport system permease protein n=1 Tax=Actinoplanes regularis TaxID=52697 RepID=A0A238XZI6_9ACTN|nr:iron chelate uptake ABC transporter family permease subunit [Actinoplanes regularis]GIE86308.1 ABC transporter permease [Actinoplanes regularis]GLW28008.1 ABC transporter permease [Actinoplanes regularis]SNR64466.1 iron complex transport system permease protein [Actinoplanes regularis]
MMVLRSRAVVTGGVALLAMAAVAVLTLGTGEFPIAPADVVKTLVGQGNAAQSFIINELRLPRVITAILVGMALAAGGAVFQSITRNPLGSPDILGITSGAGTAALAVVIVGGSSTQLSLAAVAGGIAVALLIQLIGGRRGLQGYRFILIGVGMTAILNGIMGWLLTKGVQMENARAMLWLTGSFDGRGWEEALPLLGVLVVTIPILAVACGPGLRMLEMGDDIAAGLGVPVKRLRNGALLTASLVVACAAAAAGPVQFVALIAPNIARRLTRAPGPNLLPSMAIGALLTVGADWLAVHSGYPLPVGVVTGALGGGYLIWLLVSERKAGRI